MNRFFAYFMIAILAVTGVPALHADNRIVLGPDQIIKFLAHDQCDTYRLWDELRGHDALEKLTKMVHAVFEHRAQRADGLFIPIECSLQELTEKLGFISDIDDEGVACVVAKNKQAFLHDLEQSNQSHMVVVPACEWGYSCTDLYRTIGKIVASYFAQSTSEERLCDKFFMEHPTIHIFIQKTENGLECVGSPLGTQDVFESYCDAVTYGGNKSGVSWQNKLFLGLAMGSLLSGVCQAKTESDVVLPEICNSLSRDVISQGCWCGNLKLLCKPVDNMCNATVDLIASRAQREQLEGCEGKSLILKKTNKALKKSLTQARKGRYDDVLEKKQEIKYFNALEKMSLKCEKRFKNLLTGLERIAKDSDSCSIDLLLLKEQGWHLKKSLEKLATRNGKLIKNVEKYQNILLESKRIALKRGVKQGSVFKLGDDHFEMVSQVLDLMHEWAMIAEEYILLH